MSVMDIQKTIFHFFKTPDINQGARSRQAVGILQKMGYENVKNIGGIAAYTGKVER